MGSERSCSTASRTEHQPSSFENVLGQRSGAFKFIGGSFPTSFHFASTANSDCHRKAFLPSFCYSRHLRSPFTQAPIRYSIAFSWSDLRSKSPFSIFSDPTNSSSSRQTSIPHSLPSHCPPDEEQEETPISSSHSQHQNESSKSPTSPPAPITNFIDLTSSSPEPVPFALPDSSFVSPPIVETPSSLSRISPDRLSPHLDVPSRSLDPRTTSRSTTRQLEFAALVEKRLSSRDLNLQGSFLLSSTWKKSRDLPAREGTRE